MIFFWRRAIKILSADSCGRRRRWLPSLAGWTRLVCLHGIGFLSKTGDVEARVLFGRADPDRREDVDDPQEDIRPTEGECRDHDTGERLDGDLAGISEEQAVAAGRVDEGRGEEACGDGSPYSARPMAREHIEGIVERRPGPPARDVVAQDSRDQADD